VKTDRECELDTRKEDSVESFNHVASPFKFDQRA
jgi:hypothetical protein